MREKAPHLVDIAQRLQSVTVAAGLQRKTDHRIIDPETEGFLEEAADARADAVANEIKPALKGVQDVARIRSADQGRHAAAGQDAIVDLQHEEGAGQHQDVAEAAENGEPQKFGHREQKCRDLRARFLMRPFDETRLEKIRLRIASTNAAA